MEPSVPIIDTQLMTMLGRVVTTWSLVEGYTTELVAFLLEADPGSFYVVSRNVANATVTDWARTLATMRFDNDNTREKLAALLSSADEARAERNIYVHGLWKPGPEPQTALVQTVRWDRREVVKYELVTLSDLEELLERIANIVGELRFVGRRLGFISTAFP